VRFLQFFDTAYGVITGGARKSGSVSEIEISSQFPRYQFGTSVESAALDQNRLINMVLQY
jgi:hypothetical protein